MPVTTRSQHRQARMIESTRLFEETVANPCVLLVIVQNLSERDLVALKQVSKDAQLVDVVDVVDQKLKRALDRRNRIKKAIKKGKNYLEHIACLQHDYEQLPVLNKLYQYLCANRWFVDDHPNFAEKVHDKLFEIALNHPAPFAKDAVRYMGKLFDLKPPKDYYDSEQGLSRYGMFDKNGKLVDMPK